MPKITINDLKVEYQNKKKATIVALEGLSCEFENGSFNVVVGYSGCGKTTLLRSIAGLQDYEGEIYFDELNLDDTTVKERNVAYVSQSYVLYPNMTVFDNIAFPLSIAGAPRAEIIARVNEVAERLGIKHCLTRKPKHLSGGQQQRVALGRAIIKKPNVYLFDEPLSNFDQPTRFEARMLIKSAVKDYGSTAVYVTHDFNEAMNLADKIFVINDGKIEISGDPLDVYNSGNEIVESLKGMTELV